MINVNATDSDYPRRLEAFLKHWGFSYQNEALWKRAFVHRSLSGAFRGHLLNNERLEFLGDAILGFVVGDFLYKEYAENRREGELSSMKAYVVSEASLARVAQEIGLGDLVLLSKGEERSGGRRRLSLLSDTLEAFIAAIYLQQGFDAVRDFIYQTFKKILTEARLEKHIYDARTLLQEYCQQRHKVYPQYRLLSSSGLAHKRHFKVAVFIEEKLLAEGEGSSKKQAFMQAAETACYLLGIRALPENESL